MIQKRTDFIRDRVIMGMDIKLPEPPIESQIANHELPQKDQRWIPKKVPKDFDYLPQPEQIAFIKNELKIRKEGFWFYNDGKIEYLTGIHYFYLTYWHLPTGLPMWIDADRDFFYFWDMCVADNNCFGMIDIEDRRAGKTAKSTCILYEFASKTKNVNCGIQSKTNKDGRDVFYKLRNSWKKLHNIWKPTDTGETNPKTSLNFEEPSLRNTKGVKKAYKEVLNSVIDFRPSVEEAYDGAAIHRMFVDEFGKTVEVNVHTRWGIQKMCLINRYAKNDIEGKAILTTTVEEMNKKGGRNAKLLWDESDQLNKGPNGRTTSGLYRYFKPSNYGNGSYMDEYGYSDRERAQIGILKDREGLTGETLYSLMRKTPLSIDEAFVISDKSEIFPAHKIYEQQKYNDSLYDPGYKTGDFQWINEERTKVEFFPNPNGKWKVAWLLPEELRNNSFQKRNGMAPANTNIGLLGVDPFDHKTTVDTRRSNASMHLFRNFDAMEPLRSKCFMLEYINRPPIPEMLYDDVIKTAVYYGVEFLSESQKPGLINYANSNGYSNYVKKTNLSELTRNGSDKMVEGISTAGDYTREQLMNCSVTYIYENIGKLSEESQNKRGLSRYGEYHGFCPFEELLKQWLEFDVLDWTKYDAVVSSSIAILGTQNLRVKKKKTEGPNLNAWFPTIKRR